MDDLFLVAVVQSRRHIQHIPCTFLFVETALAQRLVQLPARRKLQNQVDTLFVVEVAEQSQDVAVPEATRAVAAENTEEALVEVVVSGYRTLTARFFGRRDLQTVSSHGQKLYL